MKMNIIDCIHSKDHFGSLPEFGEDLNSWKNWLVCLKAIFGLPLDRNSKRRYKKFTARNDRPKKQFNEAFLIVGRRGGKSFISAVIAVYLAVFKEWNLGSQTGNIICIANDRKQASVVLDYVKRILQLPAFSSMVLSEKREEIELSNNMMISVRTCSYRSLRGYSICAVICDELAFWRTEFSANPAEEILTALRPSLGNISGSLLLGISTGYSRSGPLWAVYRDKFGDQKDKEVLVWKAGTLDMNPTYKKRTIERALKSDPARSRAEYFGEFREDLETFLSTELVDAAIIPGRFELQPMKDLEYFGFVDPSGGRQDSMTLSICHLEDSGRIVQDLLASKKPPFDPQKCVETFCEILNRYNIFSIEGDKYAAEWCASAFQNLNVFYHPSELSKSDIYLNSLPVFMQNRVELLDNRIQTQELRQLERRSGKQKDSVDHPRGLNDDCANALCGSLVMAARRDQGKLPDVSVSRPQDFQTEKEKIEREARDWLLDIPEKEDSELTIDEQAEREMSAIFQEVEKDHRESKKKSSEDCIITRGWD